MKKKAKGAKDDLEDEDSEDEDLGNLDDDEVSLGSMNKEFSEIEEDGGTFMDVLDDENEGIPGKLLKYKTKTNWSFLPQHRLVFLLKAF